MTRADDEEALRQQVLAEVSGFLARTPARGGKIVFDVVVTSGWTLSELAKTEIEHSVDDLRAGYPEAVPRVRFAVGDGRAPAVAIIGVTDGSPDESSATWVGEEADETAEEDRRLLVLTVDGLRFVNQLPEGEWLPVYRGEARKGIELHPSVGAVPQGGLFEVRNSLGNLVLRRTADRPEYIVSANGTRLERADRSGLRVGPQGTIVLRSDDGHAATIAYELHDGVHDPLSTGAGPGDRAPVDAWLTVAGRVHQLSIEPPATPVARGRRAYPITERGPGAPAKVDARVGYTRARTLGGPDQHWHIKIYRCDTPEDAEHLRRTLAGQALRIAQANVTFGGSNIRPPWAMVPVHLLALGVAEAPAATGSGDGAAAAAESAGARLSAWFGVPGQPQADCFVLVASPYLEPLRWSSVDDVADEPAVWFLEDLAALATALDHCHDRDLAHGDIKVDNVCRAVFEDKSSGYVFIDGDSVRTVTCAADEFRGTDPWVSKQTLRQIKAGRPVDVRAHDRFCFALVVLTAVAGQERVRDLLAGSPGQPRPIDAHEDVLGALRRTWPGPRWDAFTAELAAPFAPGVLDEKHWPTAAWVARLRAAHTPPARPDPSAERVPGDDTPFAGEFGREVAAIRARVRAVPTAVLRRQTVLDELRAKQKEVAVKRYRRTLAVPVVLAVAACLAWLITLAVATLS